jgi:anti-anti-sigma factor
MSEPDAIRLEVKDTFIHAVATCRHMDDDDSDRLEADVIKALSATPELPVVLDLSQVEGISDDSLGDLVDLLHHCRDNNRRLILAGLQPEVLKVMSLTQLGRLFEYRDDLEDAVAHLQASAP